MADDKNLATLKVTITANKNPLKKALDSAKQDTKKSTSQIQGILQRIKKTMSSISLKGMVKDFQVKSGIKVPTQEFQELKEGMKQEQELLSSLIRDQEKLKAIGVKEQSREWKSLQYDIEGARNAVAGYKLEMSEMQANGTDVERPVSLPRQAMGLGKSVLGGIGKVAGLGISAVSKGWGGLTKILGGVSSAFSKVSTVIKRTSGLFGALIQKFSSGIPILRRFTGSVKDSGSSFGSGLKNLLKYTLGIRSLFVLVNKLRKALVDGFNNLSQYSGDTNNSLSMLMSSLTQLKNAFAAAFAPILNIIAPILNAVIQKIISVVNAIGQLTNALTGSGTFIKAKQLNQNYAASLDKNTKSANKANDANKKLQKTLLGFDQINKLDDTSGTSGTDSAATGGLTGKGMFETFNVSNEVKAFAAQIRAAWENADFTEIGRIVGRKLNTALQNIPWNSIQDTCNRIAKSTATFLNGFIEAADWNLVGNSLSQGINTVFGAANSFAENFNWTNLGNAVGNGINGALGGFDWNLVQETVKNVTKGIIDALNGFIQTTDWGLAGQSFGNGINTILDFAYTAVHNFDWSGVGSALADFITNTIATIDTGEAGRIISDGIKGIFDFGISAIEGLDWWTMGDTIYAKAKDLLENIDWNGISDRFFELLGAAFGGLGVFLGNLISKKVQEAQEYFQEKIEECGGNVAEGILKGIVDGLKNIVSWIKEHIFKPFLEGFQKAFGIHSPSTVMAEQGSYIISGLLKGLKDNIDSVLNWIGEIPGRVKNKLSDAKNWLVQTGGNVLEGLKDGLSEKWDSVGEWFRDLPSKISNAIPDLFSTGKNAIQNFANGFGSVHIPLPHITTTWNKHNVGPLSFSTPSFNLKWYAKGGFPENGEMFMARESGPELVGRMGNKNTVANNNQIIEGIRAGVFEAVVNALESRGKSQNEESEIHIYLEGDADKLFKIVRKKGQQYQKSTGKPVFG